MPAGGTGYRPAVPPRRDACHLNDAARLELERALGLLQSGKDPEQVAESLSRRLTGKLLHGPITALRENANPAR